MINKQTIKRTNFIEKKNERSLSEHGHIQPEVFSGIE